MMTELQTGPQSVSGSTKTLARAGQQGDLIVSELHGKYYEQTVRGKCFSLCTQGTSVTTTAALATTWTGLGVANPANSGANLVLLGFTCAQFAVGASGAIGIMGGVGTITSTLTPQNRVIGGSGVSVMNGSAGATISTPVLIATFGEVGSLATTGYGLQAGIVVDVAGAIIVPPGSFIASYTAVVTTTALQFSFFWEEVPVLS